MTPGNVCKGYELTLFPNSGTIRKNVYRLLRNDFWDLLGGKVFVNDKSLVEGQPLISHKVRVSIRMIKEIIGLTAFTHSSYEV